MKKQLNYLLMLLLLAACGQKQNQNNLPGQESVKVTTVLATLTRINSLYNYSGTLEPGQTIPLTFQTTGTVEKVLVEAGDAVQKNQLLAVLNENDARNLYQVAQAKYEQAKDAYNRLKKVYDEGSLPEIKWIEMETNLSQAKSSMEISKSNLEKCKLRAPVSGMIGRRNIEPGMSAISLTAAPLELVDISRLYVKISIPENEIAAIKKGFKAHCKVSALNNLTFTGEITQVNPVADRISRTYDVKILISHPDKALRPGMVCDVTLDITGERERVIIPYPCVTVDNNNQSFVFVVDKQTKRVQKRLIKTGQYQNESIEVISGLKGNEWVVKEGKEKLSDNSIIAL